MYIDEIDFEKEEMIVDNSKYIFKYKSGDIVFLKDGSIGLILYRVYTYNFINRKIPLIRYRYKPLFDYKLQPLHNFCENTKHDLPKFEIALTQLQTKSILAG